MFVYFVYIFLPSEATKIANMCVMGSVVWCAPRRNRVFDGRLFCVAAQTPSVLNFFFYENDFFFTKSNGVDLFSKPLTT